LEACAPLNSQDKFECRAFVCVREWRLPLQRLFSTFPSGRPGVALLLLRTALGGIAVSLGALELTGLTERTPVVCIVSGLFLLSGAGLIVGFLTPLVSLLAGVSVLCIAFAWIPGPRLGSLGATLVTLLMIIIAIGIALLGPGAFSVDGHLFGRREIVIPPRPPEP
jgi:putative oxidoreductase